VKIPFKKYLSESKNPLIVVDIQEDFSPSFYRGLPTVILEYISKNDLEGNVIWIYDTSMHTKSAADIKEWFLTEYAINLDDYNITFVDKEYGMYRDFMYEFGNEITTNVLKYLIDNNIETTDDITDYDAPELKGVDIKAIQNTHQVLYANTDVLGSDISLYTESEYNICGGAVDECLAECIIAFTAIGKRINVIKNLTY
jgi:hypothetical protein